MQKKRKKATKQQVSKGKGQKAWPVAKIIIKAFVKFCGILSGLNKLYDIVTGWLG